jgi:hypothetical protein
VTKFVDVGDALIHVDHIKRLRQVKGTSGQVSFVVETMDSGSRDVPASLYWKIKKAGTSVTLPATVEFIAASFAVDEGVRFETHVIGWHVDSEGDPWPIVPGVDALDMAPYEALIVRDAGTGATTVYTMRGRLKQSPTTWEDALQGAQEYLSGKVHVQKQGGDEGELDLQI